MNRTILAAALASLLAACGGAAPASAPESVVANPQESPDSTGPAPVVAPDVPDTLACTHDGTFYVIDTQTASTCEGAPTQMTSTAVLTVSGSSVTWTEDGYTMYGTLDAHCRATFSYVDDTDVGVVTFTRALAIGPDLITGTTTVDTAASGVDGSCATTYNTAAARE